MAAALVAAALVWAVNAANRTGPPTKWRASGKTLTLFDATEREKWQTEFKDFVLPGDPDSSPDPRILISDLDGDDRTEVLFVHYQSDERGRHTADTSATFYCFSEGGRLLWTKSFGKAFTTSEGRSVPSVPYGIRLLGRLRRPRADGGIIVAGGHRGPTGTFQVAIYTGAGDVVGVYTHPGWFFRMAIADLNDDGVEEIILGGVNNPFREAGYGATIVVLSSTEFTGRWQGAVPDGEKAWAKDWQSGMESAVILIKEFAPTPDSREYCRVFHFTFAGGELEASVEKGDSKLPRASFYFDHRLRLTSILPELNFASTLLARSPIRLARDQRPQFYMKELGNLKYLRNRFDPEMRIEATR